MQFVELFQTETFVQHCDESPSMVGPIHSDYNEKLTNVNVEQVSNGTFTNAEEGQSTNNHHLQSSLKEEVKNEEEKVEKKKQVSVKSCSSITCPVGENTIRKVPSRKLESRKVFLTKEPKVNVLQDGGVTSAENSSSSSQWLYCSIQGCGFWTKKPERMARHRTCHVDEVKQSFQCPGTYLCNGWQV